MGKDSGSVGRQKRRHQDRISSWLIMSFVLAFVGPAWGQSSGGGRYIQAETVGAMAGIRFFRVHSVDVFPDKSMRVNFIVSQTGGSPERIRFSIDHMRYLQLVSDSSDQRLEPTGLPEGNPSSKTGTQGVFILVTV